MALKKISMNLDTNVLSAIDAYAASMGVNRSAAISFLVMTQLTQTEALKTMGQAISILEKQDSEKKED